MRCPLQHQRQVLFECADLNVHPPPLVDAAGGEGTLHHGTERYTLRAQVLAERILPCVCTEQAIHMRVAEPLWQIARQMTLRLDWHRSKL
eukprot:scaffold99034_cov69-Phaeocystis_antarctica.AAC.4